VKQIVTLAFVGTVALGASVLRAQKLETLPVGTAMRIQTEVRSPVSGRFAWVRGDTLALTREPNGEEIRLSIPSIQSYAVRRPRSRGAGAKRGALIGGGVALALLAVSISADFATQSEGNVPSTFYVAPLALAAPLIGTGIGALTGRAPWQRRVQLVGSASGKRMRLAVGIPF
jgi:hypothetical protein